MEQGAMRLTIVSLSVWSSLIVSRTWYWNRQTQSSKSISLEVETSFTNAAEMISNFDIVII